MAAFLWVLAVVALVIWSLLGWVGFALVGVAAGLLAGVPGVELLVPLAQGALFVLWVVGALVLLAAPVLLRRAARFAREAIADGYGASPYRRGGRRSIAQRLVERLAGRYGRRLARLARR